MKQTFALLIVSAFLAGAVLKAEAAEPVARSAIAAKASAMFAHNKKPGEISKAKKKKNTTNPAGESKANG